jgi:hypothetical protein
LQVANHTDVDMEEETVVTDPNTGTTTTMRLPKYFQIKCACCMQTDCHHHTLCPTVLLCSTCVQQVADETLIMCRCPDKLYPKP